MTIEEKEKAFLDKLTPFKTTYPEEIIQPFFDYWTEPNKSGTKLRWELEKTWDLNRRLRRWQMIAESRPDFRAGQVGKVERVLAKTPVTDLEKLEAFYSCYILKPSQVAFDTFGVFFDLMNTKGLLKPLTEEEKQTLKNVYGNNAYKLKCAWVQISFDRFAITNDFSKKLNSGNEKVQ